LVKQDDFSSDPTCSKMNLNRTAVLDWTSPRRVSLQSRRSFEEHVDCCVRTTEAVDGDDVAALNSVLANREIRQIDGGAHSWLSDFDVAAMILNGTNPS